MPGIRVKDQGDFDSLPERKAEHGQTKMKEFVNERFRCPSGPKLESNLCRLQGHRVVLEMNGETGIRQILAGHIAQRIAIEPIYFLR